MRSHVAIRWTVIVVMALAIRSPARGAGPDPILLWPQGAPGAVGKLDEDRPQIRIYLPENGRATGAAVIICPGGGYGALATDHEGHQVAKWFQSIGVAGIVLKYRLGRRYQHPAPLHDVQRAIRYVRANAAKLGVSSRRIGVMGFSAGGHLASTSATHFDAGRKKSGDPIDRVSCRPDFAILGYPVVSLSADFAHTGSRRNLLGETPDPKLVELLSNEKQVTADTPPMFLFHTGEDTGVPVDNSLRLYEALLRAKVPAELHVYQFGPHGVGLGPGDPVLFSWKDRLADWLRTSGFLADCRRAAVQGTVQLNGQPLRWGTITFISLQSSSMPVAWARVNRGKFSVPMHRGAVVGTCRIEIRNLGTIAAKPTIENVQLFKKRRPQDDRLLTTEIQPDQNVLSLDVVGS